MNRLPWIVILIVLVILPGGILLAAEKEGILVVDRFDKGLGSDGIPKGWALEKSPGSQSVITVQKNDDLSSFLHLQSVDDEFGLKKEISFDTQKYPYLSWKWRAKEIPSKGDIRTHETDDEAGQIYVFFPKFPTTINTRSVGYIWGSNAPVGFWGTSTAYSKMKYVVLQSGSKNLNEWITETRNVFDDFQKLFQEEPPKVGGVLIYINTEHTHGKAVIEYTDIFFSAVHPAPAQTPAK